MNKPTGPSNPSTDARRQAWLKNVEERARLTLAPALAPNADASAMATAVAAAHSLTDENVGMIFANADQKRRMGTPLPQVACKKGCDYCCSLRVKVAVPEVIAIAEYIEANWSVEEKAALLVTIEEYQNQFVGLTALERINKMAPCPLLVDHACSVYPVRPISSRKHHSVDVEVCKQAQLQPDKVQIPHYLEVDTVVMPIISGLQTAIKARGLKSAMVILVPALKIALSDPTAKARWLKGEDVFAAAVDRGIEQQASFSNKRKLPFIEV